MTRLAAVPSPRALLGPVRGLRRAAANRVERRAYSPPDFDVIPEHGRSGPAALAAAGASLAQFMRRVGLPRRGQQTLQILLRMMPEADALWSELAAAALAGGPDGAVVDPVLGVCTRPVGDPVAARVAIERTPSADTDAASLRLTARSYQSQGAFDQAEARWRRVTERPEATAGDWYAFGRIRAAEAARRGGFTDADVAAHRDRLMRALELDPGHHHARYHLCRVSIRTGDWVTAIRAADRSGRHASELIDLTSRHLESDVVAAALAARADGPERWSNDLFVTLHWWLWHRGAPTEAFAVKAASARHVLGGTPTATRAYIDRVRAHVALSDHESARREASRLTRHGIDPASARKIQADVELFFGDPDAHRARRALRPSPLGAVVDGRHVDVVGPQADSAASSEVVIRTKWLGQGGADVQVDASYYPENVAASESDRLLELLGRGGLPLAVLRPASILTAPASLLDHPHVRHSPDEFSAHLEASPFAIQRILYDVLACNPSSVSVSGTDFFLSGESPAGYRIDAEARGARGLIDAIAGYGHDVLGDLRWSRNLRDSGLVEFSDIGERALDQSDAGYLRLLERRPAGSTDRTEPGGLMGPGDPDSPS